MSNRAAYVIGDELGDLTITWRDDAGALIDFSTGYTFVLKIGAKGSAALITKSTAGDFTGAATAPTLPVRWNTTGELNSLTAGLYTVQVAATRTSGTKVRTLQGQIEIRGAVT